MVQYFPRLRTGVAGPAKRVPSLLGGPGSRGIKMSKLASVSLDRKLEGQIPQHVAFYPPFTPKGREQITHLFSHDIGIYTEMKAAKHLRWNGIEVKTARRHVVHLNDLRYFTEAGHAFAESIVRRLLADCEKPLWSVTSPRGDGNKPIVRGLAKYRINTALRQALRNAGYYMDGRRLSGEDLQKQAQILGRPVAQEARRRGILQLFASGGRTRENI
ncbi:hypothetical protein M406DRAFT_349756 [Cryphonectria parasitica EP155]|uniref:Uncharacterized protein n=1 Tax=Cryphonectria parasitica (strain ATCC 38755 / EP155) TaxID=660469 RepID=A0A9P4Y7R9_CRYP1|nr:uncharacterized protein M406DRAFT_349756 [Cryphonectria parasitica EP155]KAF3768534.1 hypothetical protein M406DRAFT_349756 [Cryphonectria parasitica EP155]